MHRWLRWQSIFNVLHVAYVAGDDAHRSVRVMRAQRDELGALQTGAGSEDEFAFSTDRLDPNSSLNLQCDDMPSGFCCGLSPKKIRIDTGEEKCACAGPEEGGKFGTQEAIDKYCKEASSSLM